jgi:hypothetical protein
MSRHSLALGALLGLAWIGCELDPDDSSTNGTRRPSCSASDLECGEGWDCIARQTLELCTRDVIVPDLCERTTHLCMARGILGPNEICIDDRECIDGLVCLNAESGNTRCQEPQCLTTAACPDGYSCRRLLCEITTEGSYCSAEYQCARHQYCNGSSCTAAPEGGGNPCRHGDSECAPGRVCVPSVLGGSSTLCSECERDDECSGHPRGSYCHELQCTSCNDAACPGQICLPGLGCVDCVDNEDCEDDRICSGSVCLQTCTSFNHDACESGQCLSGGQCAASVGKPCAQERATADDCGRSVCIGRDDGGTSVEPYCTRRCGPFMPPCPEGFVCADQVSVGSVTQSLCLRE